MESLAMLVLILLSIVVFTGPVSYVLTTRAVWDYSKRKNALWIFRRVLVTILSAVGIAISAIFVFAQIPVGTKIVAIAGIALNIFAMKREYFREK
jgi:Na+/alanine symporter